MRVWEGRYVECRERRHLNNAVASIDPDLRASHEPTRVRRKEHNGSSQVLRVTHTAHGGQALPGPLELRVMRENSFRKLREHVTGTQAIDTDALLGPFDSERGGHVLHSYSKWQHGLVKIRISDIKLQSKPRGGNEKGEVDIGNKNKVQKTER